IAGQTCDQQRLINLIETAALMEGDSVVEHCCRLALAGGVRHQCREVAPQCSPFGKGDSHKTIGTSAKAGHRVWRTRVFTQRKARRKTEPANISIVFPLQ